MCEKCEQLDQKIDHVRKLADAGLDELTLSRFASLVEEYERQKSALHPDDWGIYRDIPRFADSGGPAGARSSSLVRRKAAHPDAV